MPLKTRLREIKLTQTYQVNKHSRNRFHRMHRIHLGNEKKYVETNIKHAEAHLRHWTAILNMNFLKLRNIYADLYAEVLKKWPYLHDKEYILMLKDLEEIHKLFTLSYGRQSSVNYNYFIFNWANSIIRQLQKVIRNFVRLLRSCSRLDHTFPHKQLLAELKVIKNDLCLK